MALLKFIIITSLLFGGGYVFGTNVWVFAFACLIGANMARTA